LKKKEERFGNFDLGQRYCLGKIDLKILRYSHIKEIAKK